MSEAGNRPKGRGYFARRIWHSPEGFGKKSMVSRAALPPSGSEKRKPVAP